MLTLGWKEPALAALVAAAAVALAAGTVLLAYSAGPFVPLFVAVGAVAAVLALWVPIGALCVAVALIPVQVSSLSIGGVGISGAEVMFVLTGLGWATRRLLDGEAPVVPSPLGKPLALLLLAIVPGIVVSDEPFSVLKILIMWTAFFFVYQVIVADGRSSTVRLVLLVLAVSSAVVGAIAVFGSATGPAPELLGSGEEATGRAIGSFGHPNDLATFQTIGFSVALALALEKGSWRRPVAAIAFLLSFAGLALSLSRGGMLAAAGALGVMLLWRPFRRAVLIAALVLAPFVVIGANPLGDVRQANIVSKRIASLGYSAQGVDPRLDIWKRTPRVIADHPVFGVGANSFVEVAPRYGISHPIVGPYAHAHNITLTIWAELGIAGLVALLWLVLALGRVLVRACAARAGPETALAFAVAAAFVGITLQGMVDYTLRSNSIPATIALLAGCGVALGRSLEPAESPAS